MLAAKLVAAKQTDIALTRNTYIPIYACNTYIYREKEEEVEARVMSSACNHCVYAAS